MNIENSKILFKSLWNVDPEATSHGCGEKRILLSNKETSSSITQIAVTLLHQGEKAELHSHPTMEECFLIRSGRLRISVDNQTFDCMPGDFLRIPPATPHQLEALEESEMLTIGCATD